MIHNIHIFKLAAGLSFVGNLLLRHQQHGYGVLWIAPMSQTFEVGIKAFRLITIECVVQNIEALLIPHRFAVPKDEIIPIHRFRLGVVVRRVVIVGQGEQVRLGIGALAHIGQHIIKLVFFIVFHVKPADKRPA